MKNRRLIVCSTATQGCFTAETNVSLEFILLVPKEQNFDGVVNFPKVHDGFTFRKFDIELPYKRSPIDLNCCDACMMENYKQQYSELRLTELDRFSPIDLALSEECLDDYDYYTVLEDEYDGHFNNRHIYIAPKFTSEFKRLLQVGYSVDMHIKEPIDSAEQGNVRAMNALALIYFDGDGVEQDFEEAAKWWRMAAEKSIEIFRNKQNS